MSNHKIDNNYVAVLLHGLKQKAKANGKALSDSEALEQAASYLEEVAWELRLMGSEPNMTLRVDCCAFTWPDTTQVRVPTVPKDPRVNS